MEELAIDGIGEPQGGGLRHEAAGNEEVVSVRMQCQMSVRKAIFSVNAAFTFEERNANRQKSRYQSGSHCTFFFLSFLSHKSYLCC